MNRIELLYFEDCPSWQITLRYLQNLLGDGANIELVRVSSDAEAAARRFTGSPTIRVDGVDLFPPGHEDYALACRVYYTPDGSAGTPTADMIRDALREAGVEIVSGD